MYPQGQLERVGEANQWRGTPQKGARRSSVTLRQARKGYREDRYDMRVPYGFGLELRAITPAWPDSGSSARPSNDHPTVDHLGA